MVISTICTVWVSQVTSTTSKPEFGELYALIHDNISGTRNHVDQSKVILISHSLSIEWCSESQPPPKIVHLLLTITY